MPPFSTQLQPATTIPGTYTEDSNKYSFGGTIEKLLCFENRTSTLFMLVFFADFTTISNVSPIEISF